MVYLADPQQPVNSMPPPRKSRWWIILLVVLGVLFSGTFLLFAGLYFMFKSSLEPKPVAIKSHSVIQLKASGELEEYVSSQPFSLLGEESVSNISFLDALTALRRAKTDKHIAGLYYRSGGWSMGFAKAVELRQAMLDFKQSGKFIHAFLEVGGELDYFFASAADSVFMPTEGVVELNGFAVSQLFWQGTLQKLGVEPFVTQFEEYKSAAESYSEKKFSSYAREELRSLLTDRFGDYVDAIASARKLESAQVAGALRRGVYSADAALEVHFIDAIRSESAVKNRMARAAGGDSSKDDGPNMISLSQYVRHLEQKPTGSVVRHKEIAIVYGSGMMVPGRADDGGPFGETMIGSDSFIRDLRRAAKDEDVKAIIIRIDSPGGTVLAADAIWEEIQRIKKIKPVYASMSDVAASGGYYMAMACDTIIAHPSTITGSIGVIAMIPNLSGTLAKIGASVDTVATSPSANFLNPFLPFTAQDRLTFHRISEPIYRRFVQRVADSRHKTFAETRQVARGRVWTGEEAQRIGLVDQLGGLQETIKIVKRRLGVSETERVRLRIFPEPRDPLESFLRILQRTEQPGFTGRALARQDDPWFGLQRATVRKQVAYLYSLYYIGREGGMLAALPFLPVAE